MGVWPIVHGVFTCAGLSCRPRVDWAISGRLPSLPAILHCSLKLNNMLVKAPRAQDHQDPPRDPLERVMDESSKASSRRPFPNWSAITERC